MVLITKNFQHGRANRQKAPVNTCFWIHSLVSQDNLYQSKRDNVEGFSQDGVLSRIVLPHSTYRNARLKNNLKKFIPKFKIREKKFSRNL